MSDRSESSLKKQRLLSPSKNACIVFEISKGRIRNTFPYEYQIYYVDCDPNSSSGNGCDEFTHTKPTFRYESRYLLAFCGLDSTLYMFEGHDVRTRGETGFAAKFEITPKIIESEEDNKLVRLKRMRYRKYDPAALPTPDGKSILVFSLRIEKCYDPTFELYDIAGDSYQRLPDLAPSITSLFLEPDDTCAHITAYGFVSNSRFMVETVSEMFVLDLSEDIKKWRRLNGWFPKAGNRFIGTNDGFFFTSDCVCDVALAKKSFPLPISPLPPHEEDDFIQYSSCTALLDDHYSNVGGACNTCVVQAESYPRCAQYAFKCDSDRDKYTRCREDICLLVVDICSTTNIQRYKTEVMKKYKRYKEQVLDGDEGGKGPRLRSTAIKTLKFMINVDFVSFHSMALFSI